MTSEYSIQENLRLLLEDEELEDPQTGEEQIVRTVRSFSERGLLTNNSGLVVKMEDGSEFQITIVRV